MTWHGVVLVLWKQEESIKKKHERNLDSQVNLENEFGGITQNRVQSQRNIETMNKDLMDIINHGLTHIY